MASQVPLFVTVMMVFFDALLGYLLYYQVRARRELKREHRDFHLTKDLLQYRKESMRLMCVLIGLTKACMTVFLLLLVAVDESSATWLTVALWICFALIQSLAIFLCARFAGVVVRSHHDLLANSYTASLNLSARSRAMLMLSANSADCALCIDWAQVVSFSGVIAVFVLVFGVIVAAAAGPQVYNGFALLVALLDLFIVGMLQQSTRYVTQKTSKSAKRVSRSISRVEYDNQLETLFHMRTILALIVLLLVYPNESMAMSALRLAGVTLGQSKQRLPFPFWWDLLCWSLHVYSAVLIVMTYTWIDVEHVAQSKMRAESAAVKRERVSRVSHQLALGQAAAAGGVGNRSLVGSAADDENDTPVPGEKTRAGLGQYNYHYSAHGRYASQHQLTADGAFPQVVSVASAAEMRYGIGACSTGALRGLARSHSLGRDSTGLGGSGMAARGIKPPLVAATGLSSSPSASSMSSRSGTGFSSRLDLDDDEAATAAAGRGAGGGGGLPGFQRYHSVDVLPGSKRGVGGRVGGGVRRSGLPAMGGPRESRSVTWGSRQASSPMVGLAAGAGGAAGRRLSSPQHSLWSMDLEGLIRTGVTVEKFFKEVQRRSSIVTPKSAALYGEMHRETFEASSRGGASGGGVGGPGMMFRQFSSSMGRDSGAGSGSGSASGSESSADADHEFVMTADGTRSQSPSGRTMTGGAAGGGGGSSRGKRDASLTISSEAAVMDLHHREYGSAASGVAKGGRRTSRAASTTRTTSTMKILKEDQVMTPIRPGDDDDCDFGVAAGGVAAAAAAKIPATIGEEDVTPESKEGDKSFGDAMDAVDEMVPAAVQSKRAKEKARAKARAKARMRAELSDREASTSYTSSIGSHTHTHTLPAATVAMADREYSAERDGRLTTPAQKAIDSEEIMGRSVTDFVDTALDLPLQAKHVVQTSSEPDAIEIYDEVDFS